nr:hypothetical protein [Tanacetum cinerariifolium]
MEIGKGKTSSDDDEGFIEVIKKKSCALNAVNPVIEQVEMGNKASTSGVQEDGKRSTPLVEKINIIEKHLLKRKCVLVDDDGKPLENVDYSGEQGTIVVCMSWINFPPIHATCLEKLLS